VIKSRATFSLLSAALMLAVVVNGCGSGLPPKPDLPASVSPGWKLGAFNPIAKPAELPDAPTCWQGKYSGQGTAEVLICGYKAGGAFNAAQRARAEGQAVKFDQGPYFVLVRWNNAPKVAVTALVRAIQKSLH
jgi:hypothetical protein